MVLVCLDPILQGRFQHIATNGAGAISSAAVRGKAFAALPYDWLRFLRCCLSSCLCPSGQWKDVAPRFDTASFASVKKVSGHVLVFCVGTNVMLQEGGTEQEKEQAQ